MDNVDGFILDLRNNPGGLLNQAIYVSDAFLDAGEIVSTRGREPKTATAITRSWAIWRGQTDRCADQRRLGLGLGNRGRGVARSPPRHRRWHQSHSAKGRSRRLCRLQGDGAMRLTTARYYTPSGRSIQALGVSPTSSWNSPSNLPVDGQEDAAPKRRGLRPTCADQLNNDSLTEDEIRQIEADRARAEAAAALRLEDYQLAYAIDILKGLEALGPQE